jgi:hypothetical protein
MDTDYSNAFVDYMIDDYKHSDNTIHCPCGSVLNKKGKTNYSIRYVKAHLKTKKHRKFAGDNSVIETKYDCNECDYHTNKKSDFKRHTLTQSHMRKTGLIRRSEGTGQNEEPLYICPCGLYQTNIKSYLNRHQKTQKHKKICNSQKQIKITVPDNTPQDIELFYPKRIEDLTAEKTFVQSGTWIRKIQVLQQTTKERSENKRKTTKERPPKNDETRIPEKRRTLKKVRFKIE